MINEECQYRFEAANIEKTPINFENICAVPGKHGHSIRIGQSGDALTFRNRLIGVLAWEQPVSGENTALLPIGFTRISPHLGWINRQLNGPDKMLQFD